ncbi:amidohydrolase [Bacillus carboniphilus]|uniref:Amidohydrolase n=1 Tax=Bacillus carboniphilus TaxID=86663 RepID=A0ABY9JTS6_9BACI|nr:amidohydrolase [Bacillus carboniphilus]WLR42224.1 amidohydrolase [Bacillus carboniphilus]
MRINDYVYEQQQYLHSIPEPAFEEKNTATYIAEQLKGLGYEVTEHIAKTGVTGKLVGKKEHPCVAIRADMDCIIHELSNETFYRHSCGHDAHCSIALGIAKLLKDKMEELDGSIKFIFQPAEEIGAGAKALVAEGVMDDVDYLIGYHLRTASECPYGKMSPALMHSARCAITGEVFGTTAHGGSSSFRD